MPRDILPVTVLIPARNAEATLAETLDSLVAQTFGDFEVLLVNDASEDSTLRLAERFTTRLKLQIISTTENAGVAGALNLGLSRISSPYILRLDADDIAHTQRLEKQFSYLEANPHIDVCSSGMEIFYPDSSKPRQPLMKPQDDAVIKTALVQYCSMSHGASLFRKTFFEDVGVFDTRLDFAEDYDLWCRGALLGKVYTNL